MAGAWHYHQARQAAMPATPRASARTWRRPSRPPGQPRYLWWRSVQALKGLDTATLAKILPTSFRALMTSPVGRGHFVIAGHQLAVLLNAFFWTVLVTAALYLALWRTSPTTWPG